MADTMCKKAVWHYNGDINLEYGGFYWREDGSDDYVLAVRVVPCSDAGGPGNLFVIESGSVYMPDDSDKRRRALQVCGWENDAEISRGMLVDAFMTYGSFDRDCMNGAIVVRFGPAEECSVQGWNPAPDVIKRSNASLENYVRENFLR